MAASKIQEKYAGKKFVILCSDADEIPNRDFAKELRTQSAYDQAHDGFYMAMNLLILQLRMGQPPGMVRQFYLISMQPLLEAVFPVGHAIHFAPGRRLLCLHHTRPSYRISKEDALIS